MFKSLPASAGNSEDMGLILVLEKSLEKKMAAHSSILTWEIPWTEEPGRAPVHGVLRVRHDLATTPPPPVYQK